MKPCHFLFCIIAWCSFSCNSNTSESSSINVDSAMNHIPAGLDTTIIVKDQNGTSLSFRQYMPIILKKEGMVYREKETFRLQRFTKKGIDSLTQGYAIAHAERWSWYREKDAKTVNDCFNDIVGVFATADSLVVFKSKRIMLLKKYGKDLFKFNIDLGRAPVGHKRTEGDWRTPEGVYYLGNKWERIDKYYKSFWISYPNDADRLQASRRGVKPGIGVMIHGTPTARINAKDWTNGCIALQNKDMDTLFKYVVSRTLINIKK